MGIETRQPEQQPLTCEDRAKFARLGIHEELLAEAGIFRVTDQEAREYGFRLFVQHAASLAGLVYPYFDPSDGHRSTARLRRDKPEIIDGKEENKYISARGDNRHLYFSPAAAELLADKTVTIVWVEAEKSALASTGVARRKRLPLLAIATGGCWGWRGKAGAKDEYGDRDARGPLPDFDLVTWSERKSIVLFDANVATNRNVQMARQALVLELAGRKAMVYSATLPKMKGVNGPDDFIAIAGDDAMAALLQAAEPLGPGKGNGAKWKAEPATPWAAAESMAAFLGGSEDNAEFLDAKRRFGAFECVTEIFSPRGLGKSLLALWYALQCTERPKRRGRSSGWG
jgi:hypothetical protein